MKIYFPFLLLLLALTKNTQAQELNIEGQFQDLIKKSNNYKGYKVDDGHEGEAAVSIWKLLVVWVAVRGLGHQRVQHVIPPSRGHEPGEKY